MGRRPKNYDKEKDKEYDKDKVIIDSLSYLPTKQRVEAINYIKMLQEKKSLIPSQKDENSEGNKFLEHKEITGLHQLKELSELSEELPEEELPLLEEELEVLPVPEFKAPQYHQKVKEIKHEKVTLKELPDSGLQDTKIREINYRKTGSKMMPRTWWKRIKLSFKEDTSYLINMELSNGFHTTFVIQEKDGGFIFNRKKYCFDDALKYYHLPSQLYAFSYHEGFAMPIINKIDLNEINKAVAGSGITEIEYMTNPSTLERFTVSKIAEGIMKGQQLDAFFRQIRMVVIINALMTLLLLVLFVMKTGMLKSIKIPGLT